MCKNESGVCSETQGDKGYYYYTVAGTQVRGIKGRPDNQTPALHMEARRDLTIKQETRDT